MRQNPLYQSWNTRTLTFSGKPRSGAVRLWLLRTTVVRSIIRYRNYTELPNGAARLPTGWAWRMRCSIRLPKPWCSACFIGMRLGHFIFYEPGGIGRTPARSITARKLRADVSYYRLPGASQPRRGDWFIDGSGVVCQKASVSLGMVRPQPVGHRRRPGGGIHSLR